MTLSILIVKISAIGDVIQSFPVLDYLRRRFAHAQIDWVVDREIASLLRAHPQLNHTIEIPLKAWKRDPFSIETLKEGKAFLQNFRKTEYDLLFDLQGNTKSALITASARAKQKIGFNWETVREKSNLLATNHRVAVAPYEYIRYKYLNLVQGYFKDQEPFQTTGVHLAITEEEYTRLKTLIQEEDKPRLMVCFSSKWRNKQLDPSALSSLLQKIKERWDVSYFFVFATPEEKKQAESLADLFPHDAKTVGEMSLSFWQALMWEMDGVLAVDSAALHLCGTTQTPSFSFFGPSSATYYRPTEERHSSIQGKCPYGKTFSAHCSLLRTCTTGACIRHLSSTDLFPLFIPWAETHLKK